MSIARRRTCTAWPGALPCLPVRRTKSRTVGWSDAVERDTLRALAAVRLPLGRIAIYAAVLCIASPGRAEPQEMSPMTAATAATPPPPPSAGTTAAPSSPPSAGTTAAPSSPPSAETAPTPPPAASAATPPQPASPNADPSAGGGASARVWNLHGTVRTLAAAFQQPATRNVLDGASTSEARLTLKIVPNKTITIDSHLLQVLAFETFPGSINDASTFGPLRYRAFALSNTFAGTNQSTATLIVDRLNVKLALSSFDLTIGRQPLNFSKGYFWSPLDVFLPFSPRTIDREFKSGVDAIRLDVPLGRASGINVIAAAGAPLTFDFATNQLVQSSRVFAFDAGSSAALARAFTDIGGFDLSLQGGSVYGGYHVGAGVAGEVATLGVRAEATYFFARDTAPLDVPSQPSPVEVQLFRTAPRFLVGFERRFENSLYVSAEYLYNGVVPGNGDYYTPTLQLAFGETPDLSRHLAGVVVSYDIIPTLVARLAGVAGFAPGVSGLIAPSLDWSVAENADFQAGALVSLGRAPTFSADAPPVLQSEFGSFPTAYYLFFKLYF
jgi:hypothetical protein